MINILILNFEGVDGATTWIDDAQGLIVDYVLDCHISTDQHYSGSSSLHLLAVAEDTAQFQYTFTPSTFPNSSSFSLSFALYVPTGAEYGGISLTSTEALGGFDFIYDTGSQEFYFGVQDREGNMAFWKDGILPELDVWNTYSIEVIGQTVTFFINEVAVASGDASISDPFAITDYYLSVSLDNAYIDAVSIISHDAHDVRYWVGNSGNWSDTAHWSLESGGPSGASVPTTGETAIFDENSGSTILVLISSEVLCDISIMPDAYYKVSFGLVNGGVLSLLDDLKHISGLLVGGSSIFQTNNFDLEGSYIAFVEQCVATLGVSTITINPGYFEPIDLIISALMIEPSETIDADEVTCIINSDGAQVAGFICGQDIESVTINASIGCEVIYCVTAGINTISSLSILGDGIIVCSIPDGPEGFSNVIIADHVVLNGLTPGGLSLIGVDNVWTLSVASGTVSAENCTIINSIATGGATFNALETEADGNVDGGGNTGWYFGENRYRCWINGSGNWNDPSHWSTYSGGPSGAAPPLSANGVYFDVYFDLNSFTEGGQEVTLSAGVCKSMTWQNALYLPTLIFSTGSANETLTVYGDITFKSGMYIDYYSSINLPMFINNISEDGIDPSIIIAGDCHLTNATIPLPPMRVNENITLTLEDDFVGSTLYVKGNLDAQEHDITVKAIKICPETSLYNIRITSEEYIRIDSNGNIRISILG